MQNVAQRIIGLRKDRDLSQRALAERAGISPAALSQIETGQSSPSVATLEKLADGLGIGIAAFFVDDAPEKTVEVFRLAERPAIGLLGGSTLYPLSSRHQAIGFEPFLIRLASGGEFHDDLYGVMGPHAYAWVRHGEAMLTLGEADYIVSETDSVYYDPSLPHNWRNIGEAACELLIVRSR